MFNLLSVASLALVASAPISALVIPRGEPPVGWATDYLEPYKVYHTRYLALSCQDQHGKPFFDQCCHPLLATEKLEVARPSQCIPSPAASASASAAEPTSTVTVDDDDDEDCDDDDDDSNPPPPAATQAPPPKDTPAPGPAPPKPTPPAPKPTPAPKPAPPPKSPVPDISNLISGGFATFYFQNGVAGACGTVHSDGDLIAAMDSRRYGNTSQRSSLCGKKVEITNPANGKKVVVTIEDACPTCENNNSIDLSQAAFRRIATDEEGMVKINWRFI